MYYKKMLGKKYFLDNNKKNFFNVWAQATFKRI